MADIIYIIIFICHTMSPPLPTLQSLSGSSRKLQQTTIIHSAVRKLQQATLPSYPGVLVVFQIQNLLNWTDAVNVKHALIDSVGESTNSFNLQNKTIQPLLTLPSTLPGCEAKANKRELTTLASPMISSSSSIIYCSCLFQFHSATSRPAEQCWLQPQCGGRHESLR